MKRGDLEVYNVLEKLNIEFDYIEHEPAFTIEEVLRYLPENSGSACKNIFFRNHKGNRHYLVILTAEQAINIHDLEKRLRQGKLTFASEKRLLNYLGVKPGSVSIFGLIHDLDHHVHVFIDELLLNAEKVCFHPNDNSATLVISTQDFIRFIETMGNGYEVLKLSSD